MFQKFTPDELNRMDHDAKNEVVYSIQECLGKLEQDYENLMGQICLADQQHFGRHTEKLGDIAGHLSFCNKTEACCDGTPLEATHDGRPAGSKSYM